MILSRSLLESFPTQAPAPDLVSKLEGGFPGLHGGEPLVEICLQRGRFPHDLECCQFAFGRAEAKKLMPKLIRVVSLKIEKRFGLRRLDKSTRTSDASLGAAESPIMAILARLETRPSGFGLVAKHVALTHLNASGRPQPRWASKFGEGYPAVWHDLGQIEGGDYGHVEAFFVGAPESCGPPEWIGMCDTIAPGR